MDQPSAPPEIDFEVETFELQLLLHQATQAIREAEIARIQGEQFAYLFGEQAEGTLMAAGAVTDHHPSSASARGGPARSTTLVDWSSPIQGSSPACTPARSWH